MNEILTIGQLRVVEQTHLANTVVILVVLVATSIYDLKHREVPDWAWGLLLAWSIAATALKWNAIGWLNLILGLVAALAAGLLLWELGRRFYAEENEAARQEAGAEDAGLEEKEGFGMGDVKLMAALGAVLGFAAIPYVILWILAGGFVVALVAKFRGKSDFAYVPAFVIGVAIYLFFDGRSLGWPG